MQRQSIVYDKAMDFAERIVNLSNYLSRSYGEITMSRQILRSGTSIGANICEALHGISRKDFLAKMYIAFKECAETSYWLEILFKTKYLTELQYISISKDCNELLAMLTSITKSTRKSLKKANY